MLKYYSHDNVTYKVNNCCDEQNLWQIAVVDFLSAISETVRDRINSFNLATREKTLDEDVVVAIVAEWHKCMDSIMLLILSGKFDSAQLIVRTMLELSVQLSYLILEDKEVRAAYYVLSHVLKNYRLKKSLKIAQGLENDSSKNRNEQILERITTTNNPYLIGESKRILTVITDDKMLKYEWYKLYGKIEKPKVQIHTITSLINYIAEIRDPNKCFFNPDIIYDYLSRTTHGLFSLNNSNIKNNQQYFRSYESLDNADIVIIMLVKLTELNYITLYQAYKENFGQAADLGEEIDILESRLGMLLEGLKVLKADLVSRK